MSYKKPVQKLSGKIGEVTLGEGLKLGGESVLPFYTFDGDCGNAPKIGMEICDIYPDHWIEPIRKIYGDAAKNPVEWAKFVAEKYKPDFICLRFDGAKHDMGDRSPEDCAEIAKKVSEATDLPLVIAGCDSNEKNAKIFTKIAEVLTGKNCAFLSAVEANYKEVAAATAMAYGHNVSAESSVDLNLAKQLSILISQLGVNHDKILMNPGCSAVGYGYEYVITTLDRVKLAALDQNDNSLQMPIITPVSFESWKVKESIVPEEEVPGWGPVEDRGIAMEVTTAMGVLASGSDAVVLRHPKSVEVIRDTINDLML